MRCVLSLGGPYEKDFVDDVRILTEVDLNPVELHNAKILAAVRVADPEADVAACEILSRLPPEGGQTLRELYSANGHGRAWIPRSTTTFARRPSLDGQV